MKFALTFVAGMLALAFLNASIALAADGQVKDGTIKSVDAQAKTFVLTREPSPMTFTVNDKTVFTLDGKESTFEAAIKADRKASVTYVRGDAQTRTASKVQVTTATKAADKAPSGDRK